MDQPPDLHVTRRGAELVGGLVANAHGVQAEFLEAGFEIEGLGVGRALCQDYAEDLWDDFPGLLDSDGVAFTDVLTRDFIGIVERRSRDGRTGEEDWVEFRHGRDRPRASDLHADGAQDCLGLVGRELEGHGPMRELAGAAGLLLLG